MFAIVETNELADREACQVAGTRVIEGPYHGARPVPVVRVRPLDAVREDREVLGRRELEAERRAHRRQIDRRQPVPSAFGLGVGRGKTRGVRVVVARRREVQARRGVRSPVSNSHTRRRPRGEVSRKVHRDLLAVIAERFDVIAGDVHVFESDGMQDELVGARAADAEGVRDGALDGLALDLDVQPDVEMLGLDAQIRRIVVRCAGGDELAVAAVVVVTFDGHGRLRWLRRPALARGARMASRAIRYRRSGALRWRRAEVR